MRILEWCMEGIVRKRVLGGQSVNAAGWCVQGKPQKRFSHACACHSGGKSLRKTFRRLRNHEASPKVARASKIRSRTHALVAQLDRALASEAKGCGFDPRRVHHSETGVFAERFFRNTEGGSCAPRAIPGRGVASKISSLRSMGIEESPAERPIHRPSSQSKFFELLYNSASSRAWIPSNPPLLKTTITSPLCTSGLRRAMISFTPGS